MSGVTKLPGFLLAALSGSLLLHPAVAVGASGRVLDQNDQPVVDAWVVATRTECTSLVHCRSLCAEVKVAKTDWNGSYWFNSWLRPRSSYSLLAHRDGYLATIRENRGSFELFMERGAVDPRFAKMDAVSGRIAYLSRLAVEMNCFTAPSEQRAALIPVYKAMFREAESIARSPEQRKAAREICFQMYWTQRKGGDASLSREDERIQKEVYLRYVEPACNVPIDDGK
jgi:hypothetical protein